MKKFCIFLLFLFCQFVANALPTAPQIKGESSEGYFPLVAENVSSTICFDANDYKVVGIAANMLAADIHRVSAKRPDVIEAKDLKAVQGSASVVVGTLGRSRLIDQLVKRNRIDIQTLVGKWESYMILTTQHPDNHTPILLIVGSDRRGTAFGLTSLSEAIGISPWYWWADVAPNKKEAIYVEPGLFIQGEPQVQYRGIFLDTKI